MASLRPYQTQLLDQIRQSMRSHRRICAVMPTGAGKSVVIAAIIHAAAAKGRRVLLLAHRTKL